MVSIRSYSLSSAVADMEQSHVPLWGLNLAPDALTKAPDALTKGLTWAGGRVDIAKGSVLRISPFHYHSSKSITGN